MTKFGPKLAFSVNLGQAMQAYSVPCWWVGFWLWRAGYISQDTYLLYILISSQWPLLHKKLTNIRYAKEWHWIEFIIFAMFETIIMIRMMVLVAWLTLFGFSNHQQNQYAADKAFPITEISSAVRAQVDLPVHMFMGFFLLVYRAPVHARSGVIQLLPISYSPIGLFISTDTQNSQIFTTQKQQSLHKTWIREKK